MNFFTNFKIRKLKMDVSDISHCRLCAELVQSSEIIDFSVNIQTRNEIIEKLSIFSTSPVDFTDKSLPENVCLSCKNNVWNLYDFYKRIQHSQTVLKALNVTVVIHVTYPLSAVLSSETDVKKENIASKIKHELSDPFKEENTSFVVCEIKTEFNDCEDEVNSVDGSTNVNEPDRTKFLHEDKNPDVIIENTPKEKNKSTEEYRFQCTTCGKSFQTGKELQRHTGNNHIPKKRTKPTIEEKTCDICFKVFDIPARLRYHKQRHTDRPRDYICDVCGKAFYEKGSLNTHKVIHNPEVQDCKICKKTFISLIRLRKHLKTHEVLKPFECNDCQRRFRTKYQLSNHIIVHSNVFPYSCEYCKKGFRFKNILKTHENIHTGAKPFVCSVCDMDFTNWGNCNKHMVRKHGVSLAKRVKTAHGMMPLNQETLKPKEVDLESVKWGEQMTKPRKRGRKRQEFNPP